jgi:hypothetical protein
LAINAFFSVERLPEDVRQMPKHVGTLSHVFIIVSNYSAVAGVYVVTYRTVRNVDNF